MQKTDINYLDYTWNPTHGCSPVSDGCKNCWAYKMSIRLAGMGINGYDKTDPFKVVCMPDKLDEPLKVQKPSRVGTSFMGDLFHKDIPFWYIDKVIGVIGQSPQHTFIILTKRHERMQEFFGYKPRVLPNIWLGVSVENQKTADERIPVLIDTAAAVQLVSVEPMLNLVDLTSWISELDWVICGAESGHNKRPCEYDWVVDLLTQCQNSGVPFFYKQGLDNNGGWCKMPRLCGKIWNEFPNGSARW